MYIREGCSPDYYQRRAARERERAKIVDDWAVSFHLQAAERLEALARDLRLPRKQAPVAEQAAADSACARNCRASPAPNVPSRLRS